MRTVSELDFSWRSVRMKVLMNLTKELRMFSILTALFLTLSLTAFAQNSSCVLDPADLFEPQGQMPLGPFQGECLKTEVRRNFYLPSAKELTAFSFEKKNSNDPVVTNISHGGRFYIAQIPMNQISRVVFQIERFDPKWIAAHTQLRFDFKTPVQLSRQILGSTDRVEVTSLVFSVEALPMRTGPSYDLIKGTQGYYGLSYRITSLDQKIQDVVLGEKNPVDQFELNLSAGNSQKLFSQILKNHSSKEITELYHTVDRNCTNVLFENLDQMLGKDRWLFNRATRALPILSPGLLYQRGLTNQHGKVYEPNMPTLGEEFGQ